MLKKMMLENEYITVEIAYALPYKQLIININIEKNSNIKTAIDASNVLIMYPEIDLNINKVGVFGKICDLNTLLHHRDRVEIYRSLMVDPKVARVKRAETSQANNKS